MDEFYELLKRDIPDVIKLLGENTDLKRQVKKLKDEIDQLFLQNHKLLEENKKYKSSLEIKILEIKDLNSKIKNLMEGQASLRRSMSNKTIISNTTNPPKSKAPLKKSRSTSQPFNESMLQDLSKENATVKSDFPIASSMKEKKDNFDLYDSYFTDNFSNQENSNDSSSSTKTNMNDQYVFQSIATPHFVIENEKAVDEVNSPIELEKEVKSSAKAESDKKVKAQKKKKEFILPAPQPISELLREIKSTDIDQIDALVTRVLAESHPSITALKKHYIDILNNIAVSIQSTNNPDEIHQVISFFIKFSLRISPESLDLFKKSVSSNHKLTSAILAIEEMDGIL